MTAVTLAAANERALPLRMRGDLCAVPLTTAGRRAWSIKDPVSLRYFQLGPEEFFILKSLDGSHSLMDIKRRFEAEYRPQTLSLLELHGYLDDLHRRDGEAREREPACRPWSRH